MSEQMTTQSSLFYNGTFYDRIFQASPRYAEQNQDVSFWLAMAERYGSLKLSPDGMFVQTKCN